jgi:L-alanine-DL-glutamate epimerase-like enolase superfamily enzyme
MSMVRPLNIEIAAVKITNIHRDYYAWPRTVPIRNGAHTWTEVKRCVVRLETEAGVTGIGIGGASPGEIAILDVLAAQLVGIDADLIGAFWTRFNDPKMYGRKGHEHYALSSIDLALWDLKAKLAGMPLHRLLGGVTDRAPYYIAGGYYGTDKSLSDLQREMESYVSLGARAVKMKVGGVSMAEDIVRVRAVRQALGEGVALMLDANGAYHAHEAIQFGERAAEFEIFWFEEPVGPDDYEGYSRIGKLLSIPLAAGEQEYGLTGFRDLLATDGVAFLQPDARWTGGVSEFMRISTLAEAHGRLISSHGDQQVHAPLMASIRNASRTEYYAPAVDPNAEAFYVTPVRRGADGNLTLSDEPGGGWDVDTAAMERFRISV